MSALESAPLVTGSFDELELREQRLADGIRQQIGSEAVLAINPRAELFIRRRAYGLQKDRVVTEQQYWVDCDVVTDQGTKRHESIIASVINGDELATQRLKTFDAATGLTPEDWAGVEVRDIDFSLTA